MKLYKSKKAARCAARRSGGRTVKVTRYRVSKAGKRRRRRRR